MKVDDGNRNQVIELATEIATRGATPARARALAERLGMDPAHIDEAERAGICAGSGEGQLETCVVVLTLPREQVERLLPRVGLDLAPNPLAPVGQHPVFLQFSRLDFDYFGGMRYDETMLGVPYVQLNTWRAPHRGPFIYMPRLYLNEELPRRLGNCLYGYEKELAEIDQRLPEADQPGHARVRRANTGEALVEARFTPVGTRGAPASLDAFAELRQLFEMPTISQAARIWNPAASSSQWLSPMLASNLVYRFDQPGSWLQPVEARVELTSAFTPPGIATRVYEVPSLEARTLGAFRLSTRLGVALPGDPATLRYPVPPPARKRRVLVLGGGPSACAAAYWLAKQTERYEVTLYTEGFRLGGKCAAGRNDKADSRIEEHGLHAFLGFYENAIRTARSVYHTVGLPFDEPGRPLGAAFSGSDQNGLMIHRDDGWKYFRTPLLTNDRIPGYVPPEARDDDGDHHSPPEDGAINGMGELLLGALQDVLRQTLRLDDEDAEAGERVSRACHEVERESMWTQFLGRLRDIGHDIVEATHWKHVEFLGALMRYVSDVTSEEFEDWLAKGPHGPLRPVQWLARCIRGAITEYADWVDEDNDQVWYIWMSTNSMLTAIIGIIEDCVVHLDELDQVDTWAWFKAHGLDPRLLPPELRDAPVNSGQAQGSPAIAAVYEILFAHGRHAPVPREMAASVGLRWFLLNAFGYAGYVAYEFRYSCPQTLFTPYYQALTGPLGAKVRFFHRVTELVIEGEGDERRLARVKLQPQATVKGGPDAYVPFLPNPPPGNPPELPPWPNHPNYEQLNEGQELRERGIDLESPYSPWEGVGEELELVQGRDFDLCVLGIALGALPPLTRALWEEQAPTHDPRWTRMFRDIAVTETISMQLWFTVSEAELYEGNRGLMTGFVLPEPSMANFSHLIEWEGWSGDDQPKFLAYHTGSLTAKSVLELPPYSDHGYPGRRNAWWRATARAWIEDNHAAFYDAAPSDWEPFTRLLALPGGVSMDPDADRLGAQFFNAAAEPSSLYVLSQPQGMKARLGQMESGVRHLFLCGDWTRTDMNSGCVESATQSGMLCARGISGHPVYVWHTGF